jgi:hypothetical protein
MKMKKPFRVLTPEQYERLTAEKKLAYIDEAIRTKGLPDRPSRTPTKAPRRGK